MASPFLYRSWRAQLESKSSSSVTSSEVEKLLFGFITEGMFV